MTCHSSYRKQNGLLWKNCVMWYEMNAFLEKYKAPKLAQKRKGKSKQSYNHWICLKTFPQRKLQVRMASTEISTLHLRNKNASFTPAPAEKEERRLPSSLCETSLLWYVKEKRTIEGKITGRSHSWMWCKNSEQNIKNSETQPKCKVDFTAGTPMSFAVLTD